MRDILLPILRKEHKKHGYLSEEVLKKISIKTKVPVSRLYGVATFYTMLHTEEQGKNIIEICGSPSCYVNGSLNIENFLEKELGIEFGETTKDKKISIYKTSCISCCGKAPVMLLNGRPETNLTKEKIKEIIKKCKSSKKPI